MDFIIDFLSQAFPFIIAGLAAALVGTFLGNKKR